MLHVLPGSYRADILHYPRMALKLSTPDRFSAFPFEPYDIQLVLMRQVFSSIEDKQIAIMESPTGTVRWVPYACGFTTET